MMPFEAMQDGGVAYIDYVNPRIRLIWSYGDTGERGPLESAVFCKLFNGDSISPHIGVNHGIDYRWGDWPLFEFVFENATSQSAYNFVIGEFYDRDDVSQCAPGIAPPKHMPRLDRVEVVYELKVDVVYELKGQRPCLPRQLGSEGFFGAALYSTNNESLAEWFRHLERLSSQNGLPDDPDMQALTFPVTQAGVPVMSGLKWCVSCAGDSNRYNVLAIASPEDIAQLRSALRMKFRDVPWHKSDATIEQIGAFDCFGGMPDDVAYAVRGAGGPSDE